VYWAISALLISVAIVVWQALVVLLDVPKIILPSPVEIGVALLSPKIQWLPHLFMTLYEVLAGYSLGAVLGISLAIAIAYSRRLSMIAYPFVLTLQLVPKVTIAPLLFVWFGVETAPKIVLALLITFFPIVVDTVTGLNAAEPELLDSARYLRASGWQMFTKVRFIYALPYIFSGLKTSTTLAVIGTIVAEFVAGNKGLGYMITFGSYAFKLELTFAAIVLTTAIGFLFFVSISLLERLIIPWYIAPREKA